MHLASTSNASSLGGVRRPFTTSAAQPPLAGSTSSYRSLRRPATEAAPPRQGYSQDAGTSFASTSAASPVRKRAETEEDQVKTIDKLYDLMLNNEEGFVSQLGTTLSLHDQERSRKAKALHQDWETLVYDKVQGQVNAKLQARSSQAISDRRADLMQDFLTVANSKEGGLFRDIILPAEYDPLQAHDKCRLTYNPQLEHDPCKLELRQQAPQKGDARLPPEYAKPKGSGGLQRLPPTMWSELEGTPFGRTNKLIVNPDAEPYSFYDRISSDQYNIARGYDVLAREVPRGKKCFPQYR